MIFGGPPNGGDFSVVKTCLNGSWPDEATRRKCIAAEIETTIDVSGSALAVFGLFVTTAGVALCFSVAAFAVYHREHRVIRSCSRELSIVIWTGVLINNCATYLWFFAEPGVAVCTVQRFQMMTVYRGSKTKKLIFVPPGSLEPSASP